MTQPPPAGETHPDAPGDAGEPSPPTPVPPEPETHAGPETPAGAETAPAPETPASPESPAAPDDAPPASETNEAPPEPDAETPPPGTPPPPKRRRSRKAAEAQAAPPPPPINPAAALPATDAPQLPPGLTAEAAVLDYKVNLENFYGPLDLLLHLVREQEVSVETISISRLAEQYCRTLEMMKALDINLAGEFLVMAATLLAIKARALIPREDLEEDAAQEDPSLELIRKLIEYKRFKERARRLGTMAEVRARRFARGVPQVAVKEADEPEPLKDLSLWPLVALFAKITRSIRLDVGISILYADVPLERFMEMVLERLRVAGEMRFDDLAGKTDRIKVIGTFLAILQLAKDQHVSIEQDETNGEIRVALTEEEEELPPAPMEPASPTDAGADPAPTTEPPADAEPAFPPGEPETGAADSPTEPETAAPAPSDAEARPEPKTAPAPEPSSSPEIPEPQPATEPTPVSEPTEPPPVPTGDHPETK